MTDIFNEDTNPPSSAPASSTNDYSDLLNLIRNEAGQPKYDSIPKALEALANAQAYIPHLKTEKEQLESKLKEFEGKLKSQETLEEMVARLANQEPREANQPAAGGLTEEAVAQKLEQLLSQREQAQAIQTNRQIVSEALSKKFGDKTGEAIASKAAELGMSKQALGDLASTAPQVVLQLFNTGAPAKGATPTTTSFATPLAAPPDEEIKYPERSLLYGATNKERDEFMRKIRAASEKQWNITR